MATSTARLRSLDDGELASLAVAGDGDAFAALYDRYERRVFGFCLRMLGSEDAAADATQETFMRLLARLPALRGRDLNFVAYALRTARNACYDALASSKRLEPVAEAPEPRAPEPGALALDPERSALLDATREQVRAANARLPARQREVLALRELEQLSYEEIAAVVDLNANAVAQLISRARIKLRDLVRGGQLESIATSSPDCARALPLLARVQDAEAGARAELEWLHGHLAGCETCRLSRAAMQEAGVSYRALGPIVPLAWLRHTTIARAAELVRADWSELAGSASAPSGGSQTPGGAARGDGEAPGDGEDTSAPRATEPHRALRRRAWRELALVAAFAVLLAVVLSASIRPDPHVALSAVPAAVSATAGQDAAGGAPVPGAPGHFAARTRHHVTAVQVPAQVVLATAQGASGAPTLPAVVPRRASRRRAAHAQRPASTPVTVPAPTPPATTPSATVPAPAPPSPTETAQSQPAQPPAPGSGAGTGTTGSGAGGEKGSGGCTLAIACPGPPPGGSTPGGPTPGP